jgi:hypothetical protein
MIEKNIVEQAMNDLFYLLQIMVEPAFWAIL